MLQVQDAWYGETMASSMFEGMGGQAPDRCAECSACRRQMLTRPSAAHVPSHSTVGVGDGVGEGLDQGDSAVVVAATDSIVSSTRRYVRRVDRNSKHKAMSEHSCGSARVSVSERDALMSALNACRQTLPAPCTPPVIQGRSSSSCDKWPKPIHCSTASPPSDMSPRVFNAAHTHHF